MDKSDIFVDTMKDREIEFTDEEGVVEKLPLLGMFSTQGQYYVVVLVEDKRDFKKSEMVLLKVEKGEGNKDYVQIITDKEEWDNAKEAWHLICDKAMSEKQTKEGE